MRAAGGRRLGQSGAFRLCHPGSSSGKPGSSHGAAGRQLGFHPAPARNLPASIFPCCDFITPNETEAEILTGIRVTTRAGAERAADALLALGVRNVIVTLGSEGVLVKNSTIVAHIPAFDAGPVVETTGAGDAFTGGLAVALAEGKDVLQAARFGCAVAGLSVTRPGTAPSMPTRPEVDALLNQP